MNADEHPARSKTTTDNSHAAPKRPVRVAVCEILQGGREAIIEHDGQDYRLRITANGKLILTK
jgi:hemin uptake protein HemP